MESGWRLTRGMFSPSLLCRPCGGCSSASTLGLVQESRVCPVLSIPKWQKEERWMFRCPLLAGALLWSEAAPPSLSRPPPPPTWEEWVPPSEAALSSEGSLDSGELVGQAVVLRPAVPGPLVGAPPGAAGVLKHLCPRSTAGSCLASLVQEMLRLRCGALGGGGNPGARRARLSLGLSVPGQHGREGHGHVVGGSKRLLGRPEGVLRPAHHAAPSPIRGARPALAVTPPGAAPRRPRGARALSLRPRPPARG